MKTIPYTYRVLAFDVVDGDTVKATLDLGFHATLKATVRIEGIDAPERGKAEQKRAAEVVRAVVAKWLEQHKAGLVCISRELDKYGRVLGDFSVGNFEAQRGMGLLSEHLIAFRFVRSYNGEARGPWEKADLDRIEAFALTE